MSQWQIRCCAYSPASISPQPFERQKIMKAETQKQINTLATTLGADIEIKEGAATIAADAYVKSLPEGLTIDTVKAIQEHNAVFFPAVTKAFGHKAIEAMKTDSKLASLDLSVPMVGDDKFDVTFEKQYDFLNTTTKEKQTAFGGLKASFTVQAARHNRGAMGAVKQELKEAALAAFGKD